MKQYRVIIIGGGASGMFAATLLGKTLGGGVAVVERNDRVGKKLLATGNGQGNIGNRDFSLSHYRGEEGLLSAVFSKAPQQKNLAHLQALGVLSSFDERGRIYPLSRQASSALELIRRAYLNSGVEEIVNAEVTAVKPSGKGFIVQTKAGEFFAEKVVFAAGGKAGNGFGTDGSAFALVRALGHSVTPLSPSLVALKADTTYLKNLKGVRMEAALSYRCGKTQLVERGDVLFTDNGVSGDSAFRLSARIPQAFPLSCTIEFLPDIEKDALIALLTEKASAQTFTALELLVSVVHKQLAKNILRALKVAENAPATPAVAKKCAELIKNFPLTVTGTAGFGGAQVTKGGVPASEVTLNLESKLQKGLYLCGEALDVDGDCGGYNLQWAFASATVAAEEVLKSLGV
ncbi:MAG: aminoacetone oxidase family FAD-binding enzyme [Clostridia bacterium]|nr:aminoacetone oxidase family FAD-binding enzyme [Clostridia bacterium]